MIKSALVVAPHPDDEINLAGQLIVALRAQNIPVFVVFTTNGDSEKKIGNRRILEAVNALKVLGVPEDNVIFLGYANDWSGKVHIYNGKENQEFLSKLGKVETNGLPDIPEYRFKKDNRHNQFTRANFKQDMKSCIQTLGTELIICVDYDAHPDHRAASLMFDEVMGEILKEDQSYRPIVLKKYAYNGVWNGEKDYYLNAPTKMKGSTSSYGLESPFFSWEERQRFEVPESTKTELLRSNIIYKAAQEHRATTAWYQMLRVLNTDAVYWWRPTNNLLMNNAVHISSSSGNVVFLNDFKLYDSTDITQREQSIEATCCAWIPEETDEMPAVTVRFPSEEKVGKIKLFQLSDSHNYIEQVAVFADGKEWARYEVQSPDQPVMDILLDASTSELKLILTKYTGSPRITEIEIYRDQNVFDSSEIPVNPFSEAMNPVLAKESVRQKIEKLFLMMVFLFKFKVKYEICRFWNERAIRRKKENT